MAQIIEKTITKIIYPSGRVEEVSSSYKDSSLSELRREEIVLPASTTITIWNLADSSENIDSLSFFKIFNNGSSSIQIEITVDDGGEVGEELHTATIPSKSFYILTSSAAYANHSVGDAFAGTIDSVEKIRVKEPNGVASSLIFILGGA